MTIGYEPPVGADDHHLASRLFKSERLTLARELRGLTRAELAQRVNKTPSAITQFETNLRPDSATVAALALALGVPVGFFTKSTANALSVDQCQFRSLRSASQRKRRELTARGTVLCELLELIEEHIELPKERLPAVSWPPTCMADVEDHALLLRRFWGLGLGPIHDLLLLLETNGVVVSFVPDSCREVDAFSGRHRGRAFVFLVPSKDSTSHTRFDAAHELGHLVMHSDVLPGNPELEHQAHRFASAFLLPTESFLAECPRRFDINAFYELKRRWHVSVAAMVKRAHDLGVLSDASYRRAFVTLNQIGHRKQELFEPPVEQPSLLIKAWQLTCEEQTTESLASQLAVSMSDLNAIVDGIKRDAMRRA